MADRSKGPGIIVTRTPVRISFAGGGTDLKEFYKETYGAVLSTAIDKYIYVTVKKHGPLFSEKYRLNYSEAEHVNQLDEIKNDIIRESLRFLEVDPPVYISTVADLPTLSGLGSSSSFAVGLLNALHTLLGDRISAGQLAEEAAHVEIDLLGHPIGKQDHYAAAFGGLNYFRFLPDGRVTVEPQHLYGNGLVNLFSHLLLFWTGIFRESSSVLNEQKSNVADKMADLLEMRGHASQLCTLIQNGLSPQAFGRILDNTWHLKRQLASGITTDPIDGWYRRAIEAGAEGGKLCGAGGGGFLLFVAQLEHQTEVRQALSEITEIFISYEAQGSTVLFSK